jgi:hypothetical protein
VRDRRVRAPEVLLPEEEEVAVNIGEVRPHRTSAGPPRPCGCGGAGPEEASRLQKNPAARCREAGTWAPRRG